MEASAEIYVKAKDILQNLKANEKEDNWFSNASTLKAEHDV